LTTRAKFLSRDTSLGSDQEDTAASSPTEAEGIYGTKRYGTVHSPMTEWHGSFPFLSLISPHVVHVRWDACCARIYACIHLRECGKMHSVCRFRVHQREPIPAFGIAVEFPARPSSSDDVFINSRRFDDETLSLSDDDGCYPLSDDGNRGWIMRILSDV